MAIDIIREGLSQYLKEEMVRQTAEAAVSFNHAAANAIDGDIELSQDDARTANTHLRNAVECEKIIVEVVRFTNLMKDKLSILGVPQPTAEIFAPENIARYLEKANEDVTEESAEVEDPAAEKKAAIIKNLGKREKFPESAMFTLPPHTEPSLEPLATVPIIMLDLSSRTYNRLQWDGISTIGRVLSYTERELLGIKNFGNRCLDELVDKLYKHGIVPTEETTEEAPDNASIGNYGGLLAGYP